MAIGRNGMEPCGKRAKWSLGKMGTLGEMASGRNEKWAKLKVGETAKGQDRYLAEWEKGEVGKERAKRENFGRNGNGRTGNKPLLSINFSNAGLGFYVSAVKVFLKGCGTRRNNYFL